MKTKLYKKFVKLLCKDLRITRKQLFSRDFNECECVFPCYTFNFKTRMIVKVEEKLIVLSTKHPLSQAWDALDMHSRWFIKYWRNSHWKPYIQTKIDLGYKEEDAVLEVLKINSSRI